MQNIILKYKLLKKQFIKYEEDIECGGGFYYPSYKDKIKDDLKLWNEAAYQK